MSDVWNYLKSGLHKVSPQEKLFDTAISFVSTIAFKEFAKVSWSIALSCGIGVGIVVGSGIAVWRRERSRNHPTFVSLCNDLADRGMQIKSADGARDWAKYVYVGLRASMWNSLAVDWDTLMTPIMKMQNDMTEISQYVRQGTSWLRATATRIYALESMTDKTDEATKQFMFALLMELVGQADVTNRNQARAWALKIIDVLSNAGQSVSASKIQWMAEPFFTDQDIDEAEVRVIADRIATNLRAMSTIFATSDQQPNITGSVGTMPLLESKASDEQ